MGLAAVYKSQYKVREIAATQAISTSANTKSQERAASVSRDCTLIMLSVKFCLPWSRGRRLGGREPPSASLNEIRTSC